MKLDLDTIRLLIDFMDKHGLTELEVEQGGSKIRLAKSGQPVLIGAQAVAQAPAGTSAPAAPPSGSAGNGGNGAADPLRLIESPMVGTFYRSPSPGAEAYVNVGDTVTEDTVLCIVEAMKVMNEIKAEVSGVIREILAENGSPVEFGQPLFRIETTPS